MAKKKLLQINQVPTRITRKEMRKEQRQQKKQAKCHYLELKRKHLKETMGIVRNQPLEKKVLLNRLLSEHNVENNEGHCLPKKNSQTKSISEKRTQDRLMSQMKNQRKRQLIEANKDEENEIRSLEKKLKLAKKKSASSAKGFVDSGLDYILDACDSDKIYNSVASEVNFEDSDSEFFEDYSAVQKESVSDKASGTQETTRSVKKVHFRDQSKFLDKGVPTEPKESDSELSPGTTEIKSSRHGFIQASSDNGLDGGKDVWEDIYGRLRDKAGNVLQDNKGKYIPPHLRNTDYNGDPRNRTVLLRTIKGLLNKLALHNIHSIANQMEELYTKHSRNSVNEALFNLYVASIVLPVLSPERLIIDHAMLVAVLHANVGTEIGAFMLQHLVAKFNLLHCSEHVVENKELDNLLHLISYLYNFKVFDGCLMYDILQKLGSHLTEKNIDLILVVLKSVGFSLRKDDPLAMKNFLIAVQKSINQTSDADDRSRMKYMLETLLNIKNNNISKISDFDPAQHEHLKKVLKSVVRSGNTIVPLQIGLQDLLKTDERGRWWLVGSAWNSDAVDKIKKDIVPKEEFSTKLLALAKKQKMNTENRRNIFCILMSAEDYRDAFEKVLKLGLKGQQEREIPLVIVHCLLQEKNYNPYYAHIADNLCTSNRRHQMSLQCALWDRFRDLEKLSTSQIHILAKFLAQLIVGGSLPISVLKVVEFTELDKRHIRLLRQTILSIANEESLDTLKQVFMTVSKSKKLSLFCEALRLFMHHFILRNIPSGALQERILLINSMLSGDIN